MTQGILYFFIMAYLTLLVSLVSVYVMSPNDPMFFHVFASNVFDGRMLVIVCIACEAFTHTAAAVTTLFAMLCGLSYISVTSKVPR